MIISLYHNHPGIKGNNDIIQLTSVLNTIGMKMGNTK